MLQNFLEDHIFSNIDNTKGVKIFLSPIVLHKLRNNLDFFQLKTNKAQQRPEASRVWIVCLPVCPSVYLFVRCVHVYASHLQSDQDWDVQNNQDHLGLSDTSLTLYAHQVGGIKM